MWHDPLEIVVDAQHPILASDHPTIEQLAEYPAILPNRHTRTTQLIQQQFETEQRKLTIAMTSNHLDAIKMMVTVGLGWSVLPQMMLDSSVKSVSIEQCTITRKLGCLHHRHRTLSNAAKAMLGCLKSTADNSKTTTINNNQN